MKEVFKNVLNIESVNKELLSLFLLQFLVVAGFSVIYLVDFYTAGIAMLIILYLMIRNTLESEGYFYMVKFLCIASVITTSVNLYLITLAMLLAFLFVHLIVSRK